MDRKQAQRIMETLRAAYPKYYTGLDNLKDIVDLWAVMFADEDAGLVAAAVKSHIATKKFAPSPSEIKEMIGKIQQPEPMTELSAWGIVKKAIRNGAWHATEEWEKLPPLIRKVVSPDQIRDWAISGDFNDGVHSSNFMRSYKAEVQQNKEFCALPKDVRQRIKGIYGKRLEGRTDEQ